MNPLDRRRFLSSLGQAGATLAASSWLETIGYAQVRCGPARVLVRPAGARMTFKLPPRSYSVAQLAMA